MTRDLSAIYDAKFFESYNEEQERDIRAAADGIVNVLAPRTALDVGCGPGMMVRRLRELGVDAWGDDGSFHAIQAAHKDVRPFLAHLAVHERKFPPSYHYDVVICTEVAEHLPFDQSEILVSQLCASSDRWVVFTAAPPGQGGHDHINEQPMSYWLAKFNDRGWVVDGDRTDELKLAWAGLKRMWFYPKNLVVLRRAST